MTIDPRLLEPFWLSDTMRGESLLFVDRGDGLAASSLLFPHAQHLVLTSAGGDVAFEADRDYTVDLESGVVTRSAVSRMPFIPLDELFPPQDPFVLIPAEEDYFHRRQVAATYLHRQGDWYGEVPGLAVAHLGRTIERLAASQPLSICITGDSISEGYNASGVIGAPPYQPPYVALVAAGLEYAWGSRVTLENFAISGWTSDHGVADVSRVAEARPDLVIVAYGMNDAGYAEAPAFAANIEGIVRAIRAASPSSEFVLVSPMLPNPRWEYPQRPRFAAYRDALAGLAGAGVALADLTTLWSDVLARKSDHDLTGNGINHPNDFGHRLYAQAILALMVQPALWRAPRP